MNCLMLKIFLLPAIFFIIKVYLPISNIKATTKHNAAGIISHQLIFTSDSSTALAEFPNSEAAVAAITTTFIKMKSIIKNGRRNNLFCSFFCCSLVGDFSVILVPERFNIWVFFYQHAYTPSYRDCDDRA